MPTFQLLVLIQLKWLDKKMDKLRRGFVWTGCTGRQMPRQLDSGLSASWVRRPGNPEPGLACCCNAALRIRWLWQQHKYPDKPWADLSFHSDDLVLGIFIDSTAVLIGSGEATSF